jgi:hypothetical protein
MSYLIAFIAAPWLAASGIYSPQVVDRHHHCIAEPGSLDAIYCSGATAPEPLAHHRHSKSAAR